jgi:hypothetical protein
MMGPLKRELKRLGRRKSSDAWMTFGRGELKPFPGEQVLREIEEEFPDVE